MRESLCRERGTKTQLLSASSQPANSKSDECRLSRIEGRPGHISSINPNCAACETRDRILPMAFPYPPHPYRPAPDELQPHPRHTPRASDAVSAKRPTL